MRLSSEALRELYQRQTTRRARAADNTCLPQDQLARAAAGELTQAERERAADHLSTCSDCVNEYRAISSLKSWAEDVAVDGLSQNGNVGRIRLVAPLYDKNRAASRPLSFYLPYAVAAASVVLSLILGTLLLSEWRENRRLIAQVDQEHSTRKTGSDETVESLAETRRLLDETTRRADQESAARRAAEEALAKRGANTNSRHDQRGSDQSSKADVNVPIFDLVPQGGQRGEQDVDATSIELPQDTDLFTLILNLSGKHSNKNYSLEIVDRNNRTIWTGRSLRKSAYDNFSIAMRRRSFPAGQYRLRLYGLDNGRKELIEQYAIQLAYR
jgi:hypothetical protein